MAHALLRAASPLLGTPADPMRTLTILGSTGSIGTNTLDVVRQNRGRFKVFALAAGENVELISQQIAEFHPEVVVMGSPEAVDRLALLLSGTSTPELLTGPAALVAIATAPVANTVMSSIVGIAGLEATYEAIRAGKRVGLANKEVLVSGGRLVMEAVRASGAELIPVDSEHNGAHQCFRAGLRQEVTKLILTASGGPFRNIPKSALSSVTPAHALNHPTWKMGNRITIDSATLMNKGFEVIEACWLFDLAPSEVEVVVHPQSAVHAMVEYNDGSVIAQASATDMRMPIQYALTWPERSHAPAPKIDWTQARKWEFEPPDFDKFPLLKLAYRAQEATRETCGSATCTLNAADEIAVAAFLDGRISFTGIAELVEETLTRMRNRQPKTISDILEIDDESRA
ncbi:MAG: 1-deoxy-D-xylulose-5-phosphate reductoisomerase, partial [Acidobacteriota bacterium]|nr:1-deoxy-D-xylulose-5-phosphate reductoisomerase [Acidobacteriota bacterium]